jgi:translation initiation factor IF-2
MAKMRITTLTEKAGEEELLLKLKSLGVKIKDRQKEEPVTEERKEAASPTGEKMVEKRVASKIIRRRVFTPPVAAEPDEKGAHAAETPKGTQSAADLAAIERPTHIHREVQKKIRIEPREPEEALEPPKAAPETPEPVSTAPAAVESAEAPVAPVEERSEAMKGDVEHIAEAKEKEITKVLEEAYKQDLEQAVVLGEDEEEKKKKKAERLIRKIEEQEIEETRTKKKGVLKRKVIIKPEDLYAFKKGKGKPGSHRKERRDRFEEKRADDEKKAEAKPARKIVRVGGEITVGELAKRMGIKAQEVIMRLFALGSVATINQAVDFDTAYLVAGDFGFELEKITTIEEDFQAMEDEKKDTEEELKPRPPVVTIMGHVDHGKTLLLDTIRNTNVAEREAGGITQHIGAYAVNVDGKEIVFIDTPGHEAFTSMRARGALVTDIVILVVAADDGVMPQTVEAINHARSANVPIIVAVNKIDKANANTDKVMKDLADHGLISEEWGGSTLFAKLSAKKKIGINELLEIIALQAEMLELKANPDKLAKGIIIESKLDKGHGAVGTVIIQEGTLKIHDPFIAGSNFGRVRAMIDDKGRRITQAPPSSPVMVVGFQEVPQGGDAFIVTTEERYARELSKYRQEKLKEQEMIKSSRTTLEDFYSKIGESEKAYLNVIIKADVRGTIDAIVDSLKRLSNEKVELQIVHSGVGAITETDISLAMATGSIIIGFNVKSVGKAQALAEHERVEVRPYSIIYELIDDVKKAMEGLLAPTIKETAIGSAEVRKVFTVSKIGTIAGTHISDGKATRNALVKVLRDGTTIFSGKLSSLKRFKDDVREVLAGYECGVAIENFNDLREGDRLEFYIEEKEQQRLDG